MAYREYRAPGVQVFLERQSSTDTFNTSQFFPVFIGTGVTARNRTIQSGALEANMEDFPQISIDVPVEGEVNTQVFEDTHFDIVSLMNNKDIVSQPAQPATLTGATPDATVDLQTLDTNTKIHVLVNNVRYVVDQTTYSGLDGTHTVADLVSSLSSAVDKNGNLVTNVATITEDTDGNIEVQTQQSGSEKSVTFRIVDGTSGSGSDVSDIETAFGFTDGDSATGTEATYETVSLEKDVDYEVENITTRSYDGSVVTFNLNILNLTDITSDDDTFTLEIEAENTDDDYGVRLVSAGERYSSRDIFGPFTLEEDGNTFRNDIAIAADLAFRAQAPFFYYLEVPRDYGSAAQTEDIIAEIEKIYFTKNAYRVVPLSEDPDVTEAVSGFVNSGANPVDKRHMVGFVSYETSQINDVKDLNELIEKVGGFSNSIGNRRTNNVFAGESIEATFGGQRMVLPTFFINVSIAAMDSVLGMVEPLSRREIPGIDKINGPRFRPGQWNRLAKRGVWIVTQENPDEAPVIRHQLTTAQTGEAEDEEYSIVKNFDAVVSRFNDRLSPYAGRNNITDGYLERIDGALTGTIEEVKEEGLARELSVVTEWSVRRVPTQNSPNEEDRNLFTQLRMSPVYPANNLDIHLLV